MTADVAGQILLALAASTTGIDDLESLRRDMVVAAVNYARQRTDWTLADPRSRRGMDTARRMAHNAFIAACDELGEACRRNGRPCDWRRALGDDRRRIGDLACHLHAQLGLEGR